MCWYDWLCFRLIKCVIWRFDVQTWRTLSGRDAMQEREVKLRIHEVVGGRMLPLSFYFIFLPSLTCVSCRCGWVPEQSASMPPVRQFAWILPLWMPVRLSVWLIQEDVCRYVWHHTQHHACSVWRETKWSFIPFAFGSFPASRFSAHSVLPLSLPFALHHFFNSFCATVQPPFFSVYLLCCSCLLFCSGRAAPVSPALLLAPAVATWPITSPAAEDSVCDSLCCDSHHNGLVVWCLDYQKAAGLLASHSRRHGTRFCRAAKPLMLGCTRAVSHMGANT